MSTEIKIQWSGFKEFDDLLNQIDDEFSEKDTRNILRNACRSAMKPVLETAKALLTTHIDTGQLRASLQIEARKPTAKDKHSIYTTPTTIMISRVTVAPGNKFVADDGDHKQLSKKFKNVKTKQTQHMHSDGRAFAIEFGTARWLKGEGSPFIRPALESNAIQVTNSLAGDLKDALIKYKSKHMGTKK